MNKTISNILGLGGIAILSLSLTSGGEKSHIPVNENDFVTPAYFHGCNVKMKQAQ